MTVKQRAARADRAAATRERVLEAAAPLLVRQGYLETTMAALARAAGVAVQTLYLSFGSKAAVLEALLARDRPIGRPPADLAAEADGPRALAAHVAATAAEVARRHPLAAVLRAAAADPEPAALLAAERTAALAVHAAAVDELADRPGFTHEVSLQRATDSMAALLAPETYALLVTGQGWTVPDWADWATRHLVAELFPDR
jgi:AcrR family transcriptional regulator